jgi:hypothetical protein
MYDILFCISKFADRNSLLNLLTTCCHFKSCDHVFFNKYHIEYSSVYCNVIQFISKIKKLYVYIETVDVPIIYNAYQSLNSVTFDADFNQHVNNLPQSINSIVFGHCFYILY